jgi:hypothetical protein
MNMTPLAFAIRIALLEMLSQPANPPPAAPPQT